MHWFTQFLFFSRTSLKCLVMKTHRLLPPPNPHPRIHSRSHIDIARIIIYFKQHKSSKSTHTNYRLNKGPVWKESLINSFVQQTHFFIIIIFPLIANRDEQHSCKYSYQHDSRVTILFKIDLIVEYELKLKSYLSALVREAVQRSQLKAIN